MFSHTPKATSSKQKSIKFQLPTAAIRVDGNSQQRAWTVLLERDNDGEQYAEAMQIAMRDTRVLDQVKFDLRSVNFRFINSDEVKADETTGDMSAEDRAKYNGVTVLFFYETGTDLLETLATAKQMMAGTDKTFFMLDYGKDDKNVTRAKPRRFNADDLETDNAPSVPKDFVLASPDSISFSFLAMDILHQMGAKAPVAPQKGKPLPPSK